MAVQHTIDVAALVAQCDDPVLPSGVGGDFLAESAFGVLQNHGGVVHDLVDIRVIDVVAVIVPIHPSADDGHVQFDIAVKGVVGFLAHRLSV